MKKTAQLKSLVMAMAVAGSAVAALAPATSQAGASANMGIVSSYYFRGIQQTGTAAAQGGLDYDFGNGFSVGTWGSSLPSSSGNSQGLEVDVYGGWSGSFSGVDVGVNLTTYNYTRDSGKGDSNAFDSQYTEGSLDLGYKGFSLGLATGSHAKTSKTGKSVSYNVYTVGYSIGGLSATYGMGDDMLGKNTDHTWFDVGYSTELAKGLDGTITYVNKQQKNTQTDENLIFGITKSFDL